MIALISNYTPYLDQSSCSGSAEVAATLLVVPPSLIQTWEEQFLSTLYTRWAVTGTPLQNRLGDLATMCEFLRVYPYDNREYFEKDIIHPWRSGDEEEAISRMKRLVDSILLRRTQGVVELPPRTDLEYTLKFNQYEREHYNMVESSVASKIDAAISGSSVATTFTSIIQQINELRLVCNLGTHRRARNITLPRSVIWDQRTAQKALATLATTETVACARCTLDLDATSMVNYGLGSELVSPNPTVCLFSCLKVICSSCVDPYRNDPCGCLLSCPSARVPYNPGITYSGASSPSGPACEVDDEPLPTEIKALVSDLLKQPEGTKSIVFSFWTSTLDLVQKGLSESLITYTRDHLPNQPFNRPQ
ncbi:hypothetical protein PTNB85_03973 [Pyrenophora teres f. teres]|nr:hypothetical protein HRS9139_05475 [Pyrenophora teres f. teres]KAE8840574.1 hypothetical protein PTNB85_03973 [Pyrenophora teres f. teres]KAE8849284.1 hypothetical protein HRS9122_03300 [Pyrenophora teres f. teres]KAE8864071.1 hypothetical protein PTNB29_04035 [Pyrenophora teres f. teres]